MGRDLSPLIECRDLWGRIHEKNFRRLLPLSQFDQYHAQSSASVSCSAHLCLTRCCAPESSPLGISRDYQELRTAHRKSVDRPAACLALPVALCSSASTRLCERLKAGCVACRPGNCCCCRKFNLERLCRLARDSEQIHSQTLSCCRWL